MTVEEIKVKFTAEIGSFKKDIGAIGETLKGIESQAMDIAGALEDITEPIKSMSQNIEALTSKLTSFSGEVKNVGRDTAEAGKNMSDVSKNAVAAGKSLNEMKDGAKSAGTAMSDMVSRTQNAGEKTDKLTREYDKAVNAQNRLKNALTQYQVKMDEVNTKYDISKQKLGNISSEMERQQVKTDTLKSDYEKMSEVMSALNITDSISSEMERQKNIIDKNKTAYEELYNAQKRLEGSDYKIVDVGDTYMDLEQIASAMNRLDTESEQAWGKLEQLESALDEVSEAGKSYGSVTGMQKLNTVITQQENKLRTLQNTYLTAKAGASGLEASQASLANKLEQTQADYRSAGDRIRQLAEAIEAAEAESRGTTWDNLKSKIVNVGNAAGTLIHKFQDAASKVSSFGEKTKKVTSALASGFGKALKTVTMLGPAISGLKNKVASFGQNLTQTIRMAKSMLISMLFMQVMSGMGETLNSFASHSKQVNNDLSSLSSSFAYLKSSIMSAFQPLLGYVTPILTKIVNTVADAFNKLAEFFAYLTGQTTFEKATYAQKNYSDSLNQSTQSAKELQNQLLGFDEITKLDDKDSASGAGTSGNSLNSGSWTTTNVSISSGLADAIKDGDWGAVGSAISNKLSSTLSGIDWNKAYKKASAFGTGLATFLNGLITPTLFSTLGTTIAGGINTALNFLNSFGTTFSWTNFGTSISSGINAFFKTWDAKLTGTTFSNLAKGMLKAMTTAVQGVDWKTIAQKIADLVGSVDTAGIGWQLGSLAGSLANAFYTLVSNKDIWTNLGTKIGDGINGFFKGMNEIDPKTGLTGWQALGKSISSTIGGILDTITTALDIVDWVEVGQSIGDFIGSIDWGEVVWDLLECAKKIIGAIGDTIAGLTETDTGQLAVSIMSVLVGLKFLASTGLGTNILNAIGSSAGLGSTEGLASKLGTKLGGLALVVTGIGINISSISEPTIGSTVTSTLSTAIGALMITGSPKMALLAGVASLGFKIGNFIYDKCERVQDFADALVETIGNAITGKNLDITGDGDGFTFTAKLSAKIGEGVESIKNWWDTKVVAFWKDKTSSLGAAIGSGVSNIGTWVSTHLGQWKDKVSTLKAAIGNGVSNIGTWVSTHLGQWKDKVSTLKAAIGNGVSNIGTWVSTHLGQWKDKVSTLKAAASNKLGSVVKGAKSAIGGWVNNNPNLKATLTAIKDGDLKGAVTSAKSAIGGWVSSKNEKLKAKLTAAGSKLSAAVTSAKSAIGGWVNNNPNLKATLQAIKDSKIGQVVTSAKTAIGGWIDKTANLKAAAATSKETIAGWWNARKNAWADKTASFNIKAETSVEKLKESFKSAINTVISWINTYIIGNINKISIDIPKITVMGKTLYKGSTIGFNLKDISTFATGGFPEDGLFMANHGELVGRFSNGKTAVANNAQIVEGIESGVYRAMLAANASRGGQSSQVIKVYVGTHEVTDVVVKDINNRTIQTGKNPILV